MKTDNTALETMQKSDILNYIFKEEIDFIAFVYTPWQAMSTDAAIEVLKKREHLKTGIIFIHGHEKSGVLISKENFIEHEDMNIKYCLYTEGGAQGLSIRSILKLLSCKKNENYRNLYVLNPSEPKYNLFLYFLGNDLKQNVINVRTDEGIATYMWSRKDWVRDAYIINRKSKSALIKYAFKYLLQFPFCENRIRRAGLEMNEQLLIFDGQKLMPNADMCKNYEKVLKKSDFGITQEIEDMYKNSIVLVTQPLFENGQIKNDEDVRVLKMICSIAEYMGCSVVIKPHPRETSIERYQTLGCVVDALSKSMPIEKMIYKLNNKPRCMIGYNSTALVSCKLLTNIKTLSIQKLLQRKNVDDALEDLFNAFDKTFGNIVYQPTDYDELKACLSEK